MKVSSAVKYDRARKNLMLMIVLTIINMVMVFLESDTMMLFSATVPFYLTLFGYIWEHVYLFYAIAVVIVLLYGACWFFSKKSYGWLLVALVMFLIDTCLMLWLYLAVIHDGAVILDVLIHVWILYYLITGVISGKKLKENPEEEIEEPKDVLIQPIRSTPMRRMEDVKARILLEEEVVGNHIVYRRVKKVNELVVNDYVYDEYEALMELPHTLRAEVNGHIIEISYEANAYINLKVDDELVKRKLRLI